MFRWFTASLMALVVLALPAQATWRRPVVVNYYTPAPVVSYYAPAPVVSYYAPAPVVYSPPAVSYYAPAPVVGYSPVTVSSYRYGILPRSTVTTVNYAPVVTYPAAPVVQSYYYSPAPVFIYP